MHVSRLEFHGMQPAQPSLYPHCKLVSADICHPANRQGTGVLHAEKAKWQGCTFRECSYNPRALARGRCIFKHGTGDEQIANHDKAKDKTGISSQQAVVNPPLDPGLAAGQQDPSARGFTWGFLATIRGRLRDTRGTTDHRTSRPTSGTGLQQPHRGFQSRRCEG